MKDYPASGAGESRLQEILKLLRSGERVVIVDSPPGAGKTELLTMISAQLFADGQRCLVATQTNAQAHSVVERICQKRDQIPVVFYHARSGSGGGLAKDLRNKYPNRVRIVLSARELPDGPCIVVGNSHKWIWTRLHPSFDVLVVEEAYQLPDYRFHQLTGFAGQCVLVGDPGQIPPIVNCQVENWKGNPSGPQIPAPASLLHRFPRTPVVRLPVSRRLVADSVEFVQPAFYPLHSFTALAKDGERSLTVDRGGEDGLDLAIDAVAAGASMIQVALPEAMTGQADPGAAATIEHLIQRLIKRRAAYRDALEPNSSKELQPSDIGVVCANVTQAVAVRRRLPAEWLQGSPGVSERLVVETADRFQGLECTIVIVHHPLSGRFEATDFQMSVGRLCVMLSRHRLACFVVARDGMERVLKQYVPTTARLFDQRGDEEYRGWKAHDHILRELRAKNRIFHYDPNNSV